MRKIYEKLLSAYRYELRWRGTQDEETYDKGYIDGIAQSIRLVEEIIEGHRKHGLEDEIKDLAHQFNLKKERDFIGLAYEMSQKWYTQDKMFYIERYILKDGKIMDMFKILPYEVGDESVAHINFDELIFGTFEEAAKTVHTLLPKK